MSPGLSCWQYGLRLTPGPASMPMSVSALPKRSAYPTGLTCVRPLSLLVLSWHYVCHGRDYTIVCVPQRGHRLPHRLCRVDLLRRLTFSVAYSSNAQALAPNVIIRILLFLFRIDYPKHMNKDASPAAPPPLALRVNRSDAGALLIAEVLRSCRSLLTGGYRAAIARPVPRCHTGLTGNTAAAVRCRGRGGTSSCRGSS